MATISYSLASIGGMPTVNNVVTAGDQTGPAVVGNAAGTLYLTAWTSPLPDAAVKGRILRADGLGAVTDEFVIADGARDQKDVSLAALADGRFIAVYSDDPSPAAGTDIRGRFINADGTLGPALDIATGQSDARPDVTALADGGFAVSWSSLVAGTWDIEMSVYNADGSLRHARDVVTSNVHHTDFSSIARLGNGGFVVGWEEQTGAGQWEVRFRRFDANGNPLDGTDAQGKLIDTVGSTNRDIQLAGMPDGGFVVAYMDNEAGDGLDITAQVFNWTGTARSLPFRANAAAGVAGDQTNPMVTVMPDNHFVIGWTSGGQQWLQLRDALGQKLGQDHQTFVGVEGEVAALDGSRFAYLRRSTDTDGSGDSIKSMLLEFNRTFVGDGSNETIAGLGDTMWQVFHGLGGSDTLIGGSGRNWLDGGAGNDTLVGGPGHDQARFSGDLGESTIYDFGSKIVVIGPNGYDELSGVEQIKFIDARIDVVDDGNGLFDTLYYFSRNTDVFHAGANALAHFNTFGWREGRDPNGFFDTSDYLAVNKDVAAGGMNPLEHYHQFGWREGRDPSADFDTSLYLIRNPDVAAAGVDPLEHFLQHGRAEGRSVHWAVGTISNGFDAQYYLQHNADVAAAGVDPLAHFNSFGWHEGRKPNALFNTQGYLAHYADVAAAGVNPLEHYQQSGWKEGRDPNAFFDTLGYLAANPDVAAANVNPLDHYLMHGIYEGRSIVADGVWH